MTTHRSERDRDVSRKRAAAKSAKTIIVPPCEDKARRQEKEADDVAWLRYYCGELFWYDFTPQQRAMIDAIRSAITTGGDQALAASRGEGKTKLFERMLLKYTLSGVVKFAVLFAATGASAENSLQSMRDEIERNDLLCADYPEVCVPVRGLEDTPNRAHYQLVTGKRHDTGEEYEAVSSRFTWCGHEIIYPNVPGSPAAWGIIATRGLDAAVRGLNKKNRRPEVVGIDDPDTEDTVRSMEQARKLEERIDRGIAGLGGQQRGVARVMLTTLQRSECVSAWFTDPKHKPTWKGRRFRFLIEEPKRMDLWEQYVQLRQENMRTMDVDGNFIDEFGREAHRFFLLHREEMEAGAVVANPHRFNGQILPDGTPLEVSALQRYFNEVARIGREAVKTEYDNEPPSDRQSDLLTADAIARKVNGYQRGIVPADAQHLTAFIDVQKKLLYWAVCAWSDDFTGYIVDYGAYPDQGRSYFTLEGAHPTYQHSHPGGLEGQIRGALETLTGQILGRNWTVQGGTQMKVGRCLVDANWGLSTDAVYSFALQSHFSSSLTPSHGRGVKATQQAMQTWQKKTGERAGLNWRERRTTEKRAPVRHAIYDTNFWKSFVHARLMVPAGDKGSLTLFAAEPRTHQMLADHLTAESRISVEANGRRVDEWQEKPDRPDNHWLDCLTGCGVAASMLGAALAGLEGPKPRAKPSERPTAAQLAGRR